MRAIWGYTASHTNQSGSNEHRLFKDENFARDKQIIRYYSPILNDVKQQPLYRQHSVSDLVARHSTTTQRKKVVFNIRGHLYETFSDTLARFPDTLLGSSEKREEYFDEENQQYLLHHRNISSFDAILFYYQSNGILCRPADVDKQTFYNELRFFQLDEKVINLLLKNEGLVVQKDAEARENGGRIWQWLENPEKNLCANILAIFSIAIILLSIVVYCGETLPNIRKNPSKKYVFESLETFCISWFTLEYVLRVCFAPGRKKFCLSAIGVVDILTILPFYALLAMDGAMTEQDHGSLCFISCTLKLLRVMRIFKLSRYVQGMNTLGQTLLMSARELCFLILCLLMLSVLFASIIYFTDNTTMSTEIQSVPGGLWFAIISLTCVGYGDIVPVTELGKLSAGICVLAGVIVISIPIPIIVRNFTNLYYTKKELM